MTEADVLGRVDLPMEEFAAKVKALRGTLRLLCLHGRGDTTIPWEESERCAALSGAELVLVEGDHNFRRPEHAQQMIEKVVAFVTAP